jgi:hypothetical protein
MSSRSGDGSHTWDEKGERKSKKNAMREKIDRLNRLLNKSTYTYGQEIQVALEASSFVHFDRLLALYIVFTFTKTSKPR